MSFTPHSEMNQIEMRHITSLTFLYVQGDSSMKMTARCRLQRLRLWDGSTVLLNGVKDNCSVTDLDVAGEPITTCLQLYYTK